MTAQLATVTEQPYRARRQNWINQLERHALMRPDAPALRFPGNTVTWARLRHRVGALADALSRRGVGFGDRVMILMLNRPEFVESVLAVNMIGAIAVPLNFRLTPAELVFPVQDCQARVIVTETALAAVATCVRDIEPLLSMIVVAGEPTEDRVSRYEDLIHEPYCAEVENALAGHPGIVEVAVIGRADEKWGEVPIAVAAVAKELCLADLDEFLAGRLARYKHPKGLEVVDALPRNPAGKVLKTELRMRYGAMRQSARRAVRS